MTREQDLAANRRALAAAADPPPTTIPGVLERLAAIEHAAVGLVPTGDDDGMAEFTRLYQQITADVDDAVRRGRLFHCGEFIAQLDVAFARRYLGAVRAEATGTPAPPRCWKALFEARSDGRAPWRFAAAGVNAHVNFDLAFALLDVWEANPVPLAATHAQRADYDAINTIFRRNMDALCERFAAPWTFGRDGAPWDVVGNAVGDVLVAGTRDLAWVFAERMWARRDRPDYRAQPTAQLDEIACGLANLLV